MNWLFKLFAPLRSHLLAFVGVLAVAGVGTAIIAYFYIGQQRAENALLEDRVTQLVKINKDWSDLAKQEKALRALDQKNMLLLQDKLNLISERSEADAAAIQRLEKSSAEVKEYMSRPIPPELRRLLGQK